MDEIVKYCAGLGVPRDTVVAAVRRVSRGLTSNGTVVGAKPL